MANQLKTYERFQPQIHSRPSTAHNSNALSAPATSALFSNRSFMPRSTLQSRMLPESRTTHSLTKPIKFVLPGKNTAHPSLLANQQSWQML